MEMNNLHTVIYFVYYDLGYFEFEFFLNVDLPVFAGYGFKQNPIFRRSFLQHLFSCVAVNIRLAAA